MIALLRKDLLILARSRLLVSVLVVYPVAVSLLIGLAISRSPSKPKVAVVDETPPGQTFTLGNTQLSAEQYADRFLSQADAQRVATRAQALEKVSSGAVLAAIVIPPNVITRISSGVKQAYVEVLFNGNALEQSLVRSTLGAALAQANLGLSEEIRRIAVQELATAAQGGQAHDPRSRTEPARHRAHPRRAALDRAEAAPPGANAPRCNRSRASRASPPRTWA